MKFKVGDLVYSTAYKNWKGVVDEIRREVGFPIYVRNGDRIGAFREDQLEHSFIETPESSDPVNHPEHYNTGSIECIEYLKDSLGSGFGHYCEGNLKKYSHRWRYKGGVQDLKKARWYLDALIEFEEKSSDAV